MLFGKPLFSNINEEKITNTISVKARTFLLSMLQKDGIKRLSASQLLNHDFIKGD